MTSEKQETTSLVGIKKDGEIVHKVIIPDYAQSYVDTFNEKMKGTDLHAEKA